MVSSNPTRSQYHHFIPRFILRNFSHPFKPPTTSPKRAGGKDKQNSKQKKGYYPGDPMLHAVDLTEDTPELIETPVSRTFGLEDMYRDFANATNQHHIEEQLSRLERNASSITNKMRQAFEAGAQEVWITRTDRDTLRKFLFIMKYRGSRAHQRFYRHDAESYSENDKEKLLQYMREKGFQRPVDVWFDNIQAMLDLKMDLKGEWMYEFAERIYPDDARWFVAHIQKMYLALCTPSSPDDEFLLTENSYGIHEGPVSVFIDPKTGKRVQGTYTEYHTFAAISPKLMIVLRTFLLPVPEEDSNEEVKQWRETMFRANASLHNDPSSVNSVLQDLPVTKASNSYTELVGNRLVLRAGEDGSPRSNHKFGFRFFPVSTEHVNKINAIMLEQSYNISKIVFKSQLGLRKALEYYLSMPCGGDKILNFKLVRDAPDDPMLVCLKKLECIAKKLGSNTTAVYQEEKLNEEEKLKVEEDVFEDLSRRYAEKVPVKPSEKLNIGPVSMVVILCSLFLLISCIYVACARSSQ